MKISKQRLKQIIKEEIEAEMNENVNLETMSCEQLEKMKDRYYVGPYEDSSEPQVAAALEVLYKIRELEKQKKCAG